MDRYGVEIMEEDRSSNCRKGTSPDIVPLVASQPNSVGVGHERLNMELSADHSKLDGAASGLEESEPLLSVTRRIKEKREGE